MPDEEIDECWFPESEVSRVGNAVMISCKTEDDAIVVFEMFRQMLLGSPIAFRRVES